MRIYVFFFDLNYIWSNFRLGNWFRKIIWFALLKISKLIILLTFIWWIFLYFLGYLIILAIWRYLSSIKCCLSFLDYGWRQSIIYIQLIILLILWLLEDKLIQLFSYLNFFILSWKNIILLISKIRYLFFNKIYIKFIIMIVILIDLNMFHFYNWLMNCLILYFRITTHIFKILFFRLINTLFLLI